MSKTAITITAALSGLFAAASSWAATPLSIRDSWRIGTSGTSFCSAQSLTVDKALTGMFDSGYSITCRDAALPVGKLYKIRSGPGAEARLAADRAERATCQPPRRSVDGRVASDAGGRDLLLELSQPQLSAAVSDLESAESIQSAW